MNRQEKRKLWNKYRRSIKAYIRQAEKYNTSNDELINKHIDLLRLLYTIVNSIHHDEFNDIRNKYGWLSKRDMNYYKSGYYDMDTYDRFCKKVNSLPVKIKRDALIDELLSD